MIYTEHARCNDLKYGADVFVYCVRCTAPQCIYCTLVGRFPWIGRRRYRGAFTVNFVLSFGRNTFFVCFSGVFCGCFFFYSARLETLALVVFVRHFLLLWVECIILFNEWELSWQLSPRNLQYLCVYRYIQIH